MNKLNLSALLLSIVIAIAIAEPPVRNFRSGFRVRNPQRFTKFSRQELPLPDNQSEQNSEAPASTYLPPTTESAPYPPASSPASGPYPPSGWKPDGPAFTEEKPDTSYGPPQNTYGPPENTDALNGSTDADSETIIAEGDDGQKKNSYTIIYPNGEVERFRFAEEPRSGKVILKVQPARQLAKLQNGFSYVEHIQNW